MEKAVRYITQGSLLSPVLKGELLWTSESKTGARITQTLPKWPALGSAPMSHLSGAQEGGTKSDNDPKPSLGTAATSHSKEQQHAAAWLRPPSSILREGAVLQPGWEGGLPLLHGLRGLAASLTVQ